MSERSTPKFDFVLKTVEAVEDSGKQTITCTASSDETDLGNDRFALSALQQMEQAFMANGGKTIFLNHKYAIPEDVFGRVVAAKIIKRDGHNDLDLTIEVTSFNARAQDTYQQIKEGTILGVSVGVLVIDAKNVKEDGESILLILNVKPLEASIVGIPANQRSWVRGALKAASFFLFGDDGEGAAKEGNDPMRMSIEDYLTSKSLKLPEGLSLSLKVDGGIDGQCCVEGCDDVASAEVNICAEHLKVLVNSDPEPVEEPDGDDFMSLTDEELAQATAVIRQFAAPPSSEETPWFTIKEAEDAEEDAAEILIYESIGGNWWGGGLTAKDFVEQLAGIKASKINLRINSPGGVITEAIAMRNALARHPATVTSYMEGFAASSASFLGLSCDKVIMEPDSILMIHEPWSGMYGDAKAFEKEAEVLNKFADGIARMYARKSGGTVEEWRDKMREETWFTDEEAVDAGLADEIGTSTSDAKKKFAPAILLTYKHAPEAAARFFGAAEPVVKTTDAATVLEDDAVREAVGSLPGLQKAVVTATNEVDRLKALLVAKDEDIAAKETELADAQKEIERRNEVIADFTAEYNKLENLPLPRKIMPADQIASYAERYPWLDERIIAQLVRSQNRNA